MKKFFAVLLVLVLLPVYSVMAFDDVAVDHSFYQAINYLRDKGVVEGYEDGTYQPGAKINRAEFLKIVMGGAALENEIENEGGDSVPCFTDVSTDAWFAPYICGAKNAGVISGYPDGTFKPGQEVNLAEALKIIVEANQVGYKPAAEEEVWYMPYLNKMAGENYVPASFTYMGQKVTRGEMAEMVWRLKEKIGDQPAVSADNLKVGCQPMGENLSGIDMERVRATWMSWYNEARTEGGLHAYKYNDQLNRTATDWSNFSAARGYIDHKRPGTTAYYDYKAITSWYRDRGLVFANVNLVTHSENIGWNVYSCNKEDCTDYLIQQLRPTFDFYMNEKGKAYRPHYESLMNSYFNEIGLGLAIDKTNKKLFITVHYGTKINSNPTPVCS